MVVIESVKGFLQVIYAPFQTLFGMFPEVKQIINGLFILSLGYFGWRAVK